MKNGALIGPVVASGAIDGVSPIPAEIRACPGSPSTRSRATVVRWPSPSAAYFLRHRLFRVSTSRTVAKRYRFLRHQNSPRGSVGGSETLATRMENASFPKPVAQDFSLVRAASPKFKSIEIELWRSPETWENAARGGHCTKLAQYLGLVHSGMDHLTTAGIRGAHALYQGLKRPRFHSALDEDVYIFITRPPFTVSGQLRPDGKLEIQQREPPVDSIFMVLVEAPEDPDDDILVRWRKEGGSDRIRGLIHDWEWTVASDADPQHPHLSRFVTRIW